MRAPYAQSGQYLHGWAGIVTHCARKNYPWTIYATRDYATKYFQVNTFVNEYNCLVTCKNKRVTAKWLATNYLHKYKCILAMKLMDLKSLTKTNLKVDIFGPKVPLIEVLMITNQFR